MKQKKYVFLLLSCLLAGWVVCWFALRPCIKRQGASVQTIYYQDPQGKSGRPVLTAEQEQLVLDILADSRRQQTLTPPPGGMGAYLHVLVNTEEGQIGIHLFDAASYVTREGDRFCFRLIGEAQMREMLHGILSNTILV